MVRPALSLECHLENETFRLVDLEALGLGGEVFLDGLHDLAEDTLGPLMVHVPIIRECHCLSAPDGDADLAATGQGLDLLVDEFILVDAGEGLDEGSSLHGQLIVRGVLDEPGRHLLVELHAIAVVSGKDVDDGVYLAVVGGVQEGEILQYFLQWLI